jgi:spoIIIJ-associated protein
VRFQVVSEGERGLLGVGYTPARVVATAARAAAAERAAAPDESDEAARVRNLLERIAAGIGVACTVRIEEREDMIGATLTGPDLGIVIGRHGQTIDAIQYLANAVAHRDLGPERKPVVVDAAGYRARRTAALEAVAQRSAEQASATGGPVSLEPMTAVERKVVHEFLKEDPEVETASEGTEPNRYVVVRPRRAL